jgi:formamidopyrimidine-DNA glycosylase
MPELPDVAEFKRYLDATGLHKKIESVEVGDKRILDGVSARGLQRHLKGNEFTSTERYGKHLFVHTRTRTSLRLHFGMTGTLKYFKEAGREPKYVRVLFDFSNGYHLAYIAQRMLGGVGLVDDVCTFITEKKLGPDALRGDFEAFRNAFAGRRGSLKSALMNQAVIAGIGNVYSDEILFHAGLHPESSVNRLDSGQLKAVFEATRFVLQTAIAHRADGRNMPGEFFIHYRREDAECPRCGRAIRPIKIAGRRAWYCSGCQRKVS